MSLTVYAIHQPDPDKLVEVIAQMRTLGAPTIEVICCGDYYQAVEGSHRLAAAHAFGLTPNLVVHAQDDILEVSQYDWYEACNWAETRYPAGEIAGELFSPQMAVAYSYES